MMKKSVIRSLAVFVAAVCLSLSVFTANAAGAAPNFAFNEPVAVRLNGDNVVFSDAEPQNKNGRTMVPFRAMAEAMGYEVGFDNGEITATDGDKSVIFRPGEKNYDVRSSADAEWATVEGDCAPYTESGRTYVPVRFFAEAFGMTVKWDSVYNCAVVYDRAAMLEEYGKSFTNADKWLSVRGNDNKKAGALFTLSLGITELNSIDGNTRYPLSATYDIIRDENAVEMTVKCKVSSIIARIFESETLSAEDQAIYKSISALADDITARIIYDLGTQKAYISSPDLFDIMLSFSEPDSNLAAALSSYGDNLWISPDTSDLSFDYYLTEIPSLTDNLGDTMGDVILTYAENENEYTPSNIYADSQYIYEALCMMLGDDALVKSGSQYTSDFRIEQNYDGGELEQRLYVAGMRYVSGKISFNTVSGSSTFSVETRSEDFGDMLSSYNISCQANGDMSAKIVIHKKNAWIAEEAFTLKQKDAQRSPLSAPPSGSVVISANDLF